MHLMISGGGEAAEAEAVRSMFEARKRVFVDLLQWDVPVLAGRYELDQFDDPNALYLILTDSAGVHLASARLLDTELPHLLDSIFPELCADEVPRGPAIREITRFCLDPSKPAAERRTLRDTLIVGLADYALHAGIDSYSCVAEHGWLRQILLFGWRCTRLDGAGQSNASELGALQIFIDPDTPARLIAGGLSPIIRLADQQRRNAA